MNLYTGPQLALVLAVALAAGAGYGVAVWRRAYPDLAARLEQFDRRAARGSPAAGVAARIAEPTAGDVSAGRTAIDRRDRASAPGRTAHVRGRRAQPDAPPDPVDVNRASAEELARLPGIGRELAARIVETREAGGPFASVDDLRRVPGVGRWRVERLRAHVVNE